MSILTLSELKTWLKIDIDDDDGSLQVALDAAEQVVADYTGETIVADSPADLRACCFALAGWLRRNADRMAASVASNRLELPYAWQMILDKYKTGNIIT